jgi:hypothetical protein
MFKKPKYNNDKKIKRKSLHLNKKKNYLNAKENNEKAKKKHCA